MNDIVRHRIFILSALFILITNILIPASAIGIQKPLVIPDVGRINDDFDDTMLEYMDNGHMPSLAVAIIKNDRMVWSKGYGYADTKNKVEATNKTVYMLASISKTFFFLFFVFHRTHPLSHILVIKAKYALPSVRASHGPLPCREWTRCPLFQYLFYPKSVNFR